MRQDKSGDAKDKENIPNLSADREEQKKQASRSMREIRVISYSIQCLNAYVSQREGG